MISMFDEPVLSTFGIAKFPEGVEEGATFTAFNVAGWIPGVSIISGIVRGFFGWTMVQNSDFDTAVVGVVWLVRGFAEVCCVGILAAPIDIVASIVRCVRDFCDRTKNEMSDSV
jgi:hypothetical protein